MAGSCILFARGREALLRRAEAVEEKRRQLEKQHANDVIDIALRVERVRDPQLRERVKTAIFAGDHNLLPTKDAAA